MNQSNKTPPAREEYRSDTVSSLAVLGAAFCSMKTIPETFTKSGWHFRQIERRGEWAIFERYSARRNARTHYEVVRIRSHNGFKIPGTETMAEAAEIYPSDSTWGRDGFTLPTVTEAREKFEQLTK
jgi:hypothetical protein